MANLQVPRITFFFEDNEYGWSESLWITGTVKTHQEALEVADALVAPRLAMCGQTAILRAVRASDDTVYRDSYFKEYDKSSANLGQGNKLAIGINSEPPFKALLCRGQGSPTNWRMFYLSGIALNILPNPFTVAGLPANFVNAFNAWRDLLIAGPGQFGALGYYGKQPPGGANPAIDITTLDQNAGTITVIGNNYHAGDRISLLYTTPARPFIGDYTVDSVAGAVVTLRVGTRWADAPAYDHGGQVFKIIKGLVPFTSVDIRNCVTRRRGRPFDEPRGRRKRPA